MTLKKLLIGFIPLAIVLMSVSGFSTATLRADSAQQTAPIFNGYHVYFSESNREASPFDTSDAGISRFAGLLHHFGAGIYSLDWRNDIPSDADLVVIAAPTRDLTFEQSARLWIYLKSGGSLLLIADPLIVSDQNGQLVNQVNRALLSDRGLFDLLWTEFGIRASDAILARPGELRLVQPPSPEVESGQPTNTPAPPVEAPRLDIGFMTNRVETGHEIATGLRGELYFFGVRPLETASPSGAVRPTALVLSPPDFYGETQFRNYLEGAVEQFNTDVDLSPGRLSVAVSAEDTTLGARIVVIGDRDFITNGGGLKTSPANSTGFVYIDNVRFLLNSAAWLLNLEAADLLSTPFPTAGPTATATITATSTITPTFTPTVTPTRPCGCEKTISAILTETANPVTPTPSPTSS